MRVLHIGSHFGNIGDNASHTVVREALARRIPVEFETLEIRRFYANAGELRFDEAFVDLANTFDLVLIGGGNFLEPVHEYSSTATTIDLGARALSGLRVPLVLNAVSFDPAKREDEVLLDRFRRWAKVLAEHPRVQVNLRDDGSLEDFQRLVGPLGSFGFGLVPDPGLFFRPAEIFPFSDRPYIAANIAGDLASIRYKEPGEKESIFRGLRDFMSTLPEEMALVLVPHVAMDVAIMGEFLRDCSDWASRKRVLMAPLLQGYADFWKPFSVYQGASGIIANRFHSLICNLQYPTPMAVVANYPKISKTLERMGLEGLQYRGGGGEEFRRKLLADGDQTLKVRSARIESEREAFHRSMDGIAALLSVRAARVESEKVVFEESMDEILAFAHA